RTAGEGAERSEAGEGRECRIDPHPPSLSGWVPPSPAVRRAVRGKYPCNANLCILPENELKSSCADLIRVSTSLSLPSQGVDAHGSSPWAEGPRDKPGQDEIGRRTPSLGRR